jgi:hypothetical protein
MRHLLLLTALGLAACTGSTLTKLDSRTYEIQSDAIPGGSSGPNRRVAEQVCPSGYRVIDQTVHQNSPDRARDMPGVFTNWTIRCL